MCFHNPSLSWQSVGQRLSKPLFSKDQQVLRKLGNSNNLDVCLLLSIINNDSFKRKYRKRGVTMWYSGASFRMCHFATLAQCVVGAFLSQPHRHSRFIAKSVDKFLGRTCGLLALVCPLSRFA